MPDGPPWKLISPTGVREVIEDRGAVSIFCAAEGLDLFNVEHLLGLHPGNSSQPLHVNFWQPQRWQGGGLEHSGGGGGGDRPTTLALARAKPGP